MKNQFLLLVLVLILISLASAIQEPLIYYKLNLDYSYGNISINSTQVEFSDEPIDNVFGFYSVSIFDSDGKILNLTLFDVPNEILYDTVDENGTINGGGFLELNQTNFDIFVPYNSNAKDVVIYNENLSELSRKNIGEFSRNYPKESPSLEKNVPEEIKDEKQQTNPINKLKDYWYVLATVLAALLFILFYMVTKER